MNDDKTKLAIIKFICTISFLYDLKTNHPLHYKLFEAYVLKNFPQIPLSLVFGLMTPQEMAIKMLFSLNPQTIQRANELATFAKRFSN